MPLNPRTLSCLTDARESADVIRVWISGRTFADYESDRLLRRAVEREFEIIGEALKRLRDADPAVWEQFPEAARILSFRNRLAHGYDTIDNAVVWGVIRDYLPNFVTSLQKIVS
jgi:uncharacterized protein with HEPN domain